MMQKPSKYERPGSKGIPGVSGGMNTFARHVQSHAIMPTLGKANPMTRSQALITPDNQLLLKIPKAPTDKVLRPTHPNNNWVDNVNDQLSQFRGMQMRDVVPQMSHEVQKYVQDHHIQST